jgi:hypothetical protein
MLLKYYFIFANCSDGNIFVQFTLIELNLRDFVLDTVYNIYIIIENTAFKLNNGS